MESTSTKSNKLRNGIISTIIALILIICLLIWFLWPESYRIITLFEYGGDVFYDRNSDRNLDV